MEASLSQFLLGQLGLGDFAVNLAGLQELFMFADAHDFAMVQHYNLVGADDGAYSLCHNQHRGIIGLRAQRSSKRRIGGVIQR